MLTPASWDDAALLERLEPFAPGTAEAELRKLMALPPGTRDVVLRRLEAVSGYLAIAKPTAAQADAAAQTVGMARSNFYRMLGRYRQVGAVGGLTPHARVPRAGGRGGPPDFAAELAALVREHPDRKLAFYLEALKTSTLALEGARLPSRVTIQRHLARLRSATDAPPPATRSDAEGGATFGRSLLIDQCLLGASVMRSGTAVPVGAAFVVDLETRLIAGVGLGRGDRPLETLAAALSDSDHFWRAPLVGTFPVRSDPERVEWVLPPHSDRSDAFIEAAASRGIVPVVGDAPLRRHGSRIRDVVGPVFGGLPLTTYVGDAGSVDPPPVRLSTPSIAEDLAQAIEEWNVEIVRRHEKVRLVLRGPTWDRRIEEWTDMARPSNLTGEHLGSLLMGAHPLPAADAGSVRSMARRMRESRAASAQT